MGLSTSKTKTTSNGTSSQTGTTTPNLPGNLQTGLTGLVDRTNQLAQQDPYSTVAGPSSLQDQAFLNGGNLGSWTGGIQHAGQMADQVASAPANTANVFGYQAPQIQNTQLPNAVGSNVPTLGPASQTTATGYQPGQLGGPSTYNPTLYGGANAGPAAQAGFTTYGGANAGQAGQAGIATFGGAQLGSAMGYNAATIGAPSLGSAGQATAHGYGASQAGQVTLDPAAQAAALQAQSTDASGLISKFYNPYEQRVIDSALADNSAQADRVRSQLQAQQAASGAFGGSRSALAVSQTEGELQRARDSLDAGLRSQGFNTALGAAQTQAGQDTNISQFNAQNGTQNNQFNALQTNNRSLAQGQMDQQRNIFNTGETNAASQFGANADNQNSMFNVSQGNQFALQGADMSLRAGIASMDATNQARQFGANATNQFGLQQGQFNQQAGLASMDATNQGNQFNTAQGNQFALQNANFSQQAGLAGMDAFNSNQQYNTGQTNQFALTNAGFNQQAGLAGMDAINQANQYGSTARNNYGLAQFGANNDAAQFGANATNTMNLANQQANNQYGLAQFGANADAAGQFAGAQNQFGLAGYQGQLGQNLAQAQLSAGASQFGANALNQNGQFNASQQDNALNRQLQAAGLYGDLANNYASNTRGDTMAQAQLGDMQRQIQQQYLNAPYTQLGQLSDLYRGGAPLIGQTVTENGTQSSSGTQTTSMGLGSALAGLGGAALSGWASGGFKKISDPRAKRDVEQIGMTNHGLGLYRYNYLWDEPNRKPRVGVMADEVARAAPHAMGPIIGGYNSVDYGALGLEHLVEA